MIYAGIMAGVLAYYWLLPKWLARRIIREHEAPYRAARNEENRP